MDLLSDLLLGAQTAFSFWNLAYCLLGVFLGTAIGVLPGLGPTATIAMLLPVTFGLLWIRDPAIVFYIGAGVAIVSLSLAFLVPRHPVPGAETTLSPALPAAAE